ncbi:MAG: response regulator transcription factor [Clostridiales bacterium]|nr:response regulator transcription factor [Clostridiales bacterium]
MRILIIEDEQPLAEAVSQLLMKQKYITDICLDGNSGLDSALTNVYDLILLDIMLPNLDGFEILSTLRKNSIMTPVLILSAKEDISSKVKGLDLGADDYITKPFSSEELLARIRSLYRRQFKSHNDNCIVFSDLRLNISNYELSCGKNSVKLGLKEFIVAEVLFHNTNQIISKDLLIEKVWGLDSDAEYNNIEVYISFLRKKLYHISSKTEIKTIRGVGYRLEAGDD